MYKTRNFHKKSLILSVLLFIFINIFSESIDININDLKPILDNSSITNLPFYFIEIPGKDIDYIDINDYYFYNPVETYNNILHFSGNKPLSFAFKEQEKQIFKQNLLPELYYPGTSEFIKIFPYKIENGVTEKYSKIHIDFTPHYKFPFKDEPNYDYLIICSADYDTALIRFAKWKMRMGYRTEIYTVEYIDSVSAGIDLQEKIRNFIKNEFTLNHFEFLLLAGNRKMIPVRKMYATECGAGYYIDEDSIPADIYYSHLDGNFNADGDNTYGEITDSADLYPDVYVGRMLFHDTLQGITPLINKTIYYEKTMDISHLSRGIFIGMVLWDPPFTPGAGSKNPIINDIIPMDYHIKTFYESEGHSGKADIIDSMDMGYGIINHVGHGSFKGFWVDETTAISTWDAYGLDNQMKTGLFYSTGCWVGAFDTTVVLGNVSECLQSAYNGGYISIITNSRYGWGAPGYPGWGVSDIFDYQFFKMLFSSENKQAGKLLAELKNMYAPYSNFENLYRWHLYQLNLFGDPSLSIHTKSPDSFIVSREISGEIVTFYVTDNMHNPLENVRIALSNDSILDIKSTNINGYASLVGDYFDYNYLTISKVNYCTYIDSFYLDTISIGKQVYLNIPHIYANIKSSIYIINRYDSIIDAHIAGSFIDTSISIPVNDSIKLNYIALFPKIDTLYMTFNSESTIYYINIDSIPIYLSDIDFSGTNWNVTFINPIIDSTEQCSFYISLNSYYDTSFITNVDSMINVELCPSPDNGIPYVSLNYSIFNNSTLIGNDTLLIANSRFNFEDDFSNGFINWVYRDADWIITADSSLHCGNDSSYLNNMDAAIISDSFILLPSSICSMNIDLQFPTLEFDSSGGPVFDVDGLFIKIIIGSDTSVIDFISSGGALDNKSINFNGWREYTLENDIPAFARLMLHFISDDIVIDKGVFISKIKIIPTYSFTSPDSGIYNLFDFSILRDGSFITRNSVKYIINRVDGELKINIYSIDGRVVLSDKIGRTGEIEVELGNFASGIYIIRFEGNGRIYKDKILLLK